MDTEATPLEALWQCVLSAHLQWCAEIEARLGVEIAGDNSPFGHVFVGCRITGALAEQARDEMWLLEDHLAGLQASVSILQGDPLRGWRRYRNSADLHGRTPWQALIDSGLVHIEAVLVGPDARAAEMLASEQRLLAAARYRVLHSHDLDGFTHHVRQVVSMADAILAAAAFEGVLNGRL
jgi:hypothetical protein